MENRQTRYGWLDVFKAISIFFVIYYHLDSNRFTAYLNAFIVQPFFFASGVTAAKSRHMPLPRFAAKRFGQIMVPYFFYGVLAMVVKFFTESASIGLMVRQLLTGRRNDLFAVTLWFLPCLFVMSIFYHLLVRKVENRAVRAAIAGGISFVFRLFSEGNMLPWGVDNAIRFLVYYALGDFTGDWFSRAEQKEKPRQTVIFLVGAIGGVITFIHYKRGFTAFIDLLGIPQVYLALFMSLFLCACGAIAFYGALAVLLCRCRLLQTVGRASLGICCLQTVADKLFYGALALFNISFVADSTPKILLLTVILIGLSVAADMAARRFLPFVYGRKK